MDVQALLEQIFAFILQLLELVFNFAGTQGASSGDDSDDGEDS